MQLAWRFRYKSCSHTSPLRNKFSSSVVRCKKLLNTDGMSLKICSRSSDGNSVVHSYDSGATNGDGTWLNKIFF